MIAGQYPASEPRDGNRPLARPSRRFFDTGDIHRSRRERHPYTPLTGVRRYCNALTALGRRCDLHVYPGVGHLLTRNLTNQESDFDPDPVARADGIAQHLRFFRSLGFVSADVR